MKTVLTKLTSILLVAFLFSITTFQGGSALQDHQASPSIGSEPGQIYTTGSEISSSIQPATITVTNTNDSGSGSLRQAIADTSPGGTIEFSITGTITLTSGELIINKDLSIIGPGANNITISGNNATRIFNIESGSVVVISGVTISDGNADTGGGIYTEGNLTLFDSKIINNNARSGGGIYNYEGELILDSVVVDNNRSAQQGGGIFSYYPTGSGTLIIDSVISNNYSPGAGAGIRSYGETTSIQNSTISSNTSENWGGGISHISQTMQIEDSEISGNSAYSGGAIHVSDEATVELTNCIVSNNTTDGYGAGINNDGTLNVTDSTISNNANPGERGGGLVNNNAATITNTVFSGNNADDGGAIYNWANATLDVDNVTFTGNNAGSNGGALSGYGTMNLSHVNMSNNTSGQWGGGIYIESSATLIIKNSTIASNSSWLGGGLLLSGESILSNVTISGNQSADNMYGGGLYNSLVATTTLQNVTIAGNIAPSGGGIHNNGGQLSVQNTIVANNAGGDCDGMGVSNGYNLDSDGSCHFISKSDISNVDPLLGPLQDNGGLTQTHALLIGSPAIDAGNDNTCETTDQRGVERPLGVHCDIGAYEATPTLRSQGSFDGHIFELNENSNTGWRFNATNARFYVGDDSHNRQYLSILSFDTSSLPDDAVILSVTLNVKRAKILGTNPFDTHGALGVEIGSPCFGSSCNLEASDFQASAQEMAGLLSSFSVDGWHSAPLGANVLPYIDLTGITQFRLRFELEDNNDWGMDAIQFLSGDAPEGDRPQLVIEYTVP